MRKLRHWRQRFNPKASFVFRRPISWGETEYKAGDRVPDDFPKKKLITFWESGRIELWEFDEPRGVLKSQSDGAVQGINYEDIPGYTVVSKGTWFHVTGPDGETKKVQGRAKLDELLAEIDA